jgi:hypothetical protein
MSMYSLWLSNCTKHYQLKRLSLSMKLRLPLCKTYDGHICVSYILVSPPLSILLIFISSLRTAVVLLFDMMSWILKEWLHWLLSSFAELVLAVLVPLSFHTNVETILSMSTKLFIENLRSITKSLYIRVTRIGNFEFFKFLFYEYSVSSSTEILINLCSHYHVIFSK